MKEKIMNIEEIENRLKVVDETVQKLKELIADAKVCSSEITKTLIFSAIKKYASNISLDITHATDVNVAAQANAQRKN